MRYPNVYQALKRILRAEILYLFSVPVTLYFGLLGSWGPIADTVAVEWLPWILRACCMIVAIMRITTLGRAALDDEIFRSAQRISLIFLLFCVLDTFLMPHIIGMLSMLQETGELQEDIELYCMLYLALCMIEIATSFCTILEFLNTLSRMALREKEAKESEKIQHFKLVFGRLLLCVFLAFALKLLIPGAMTHGSFLGSLLGMVILTVFFAAWWLFLCFLQPVSELLLRTEWKHESQWTGVARELRPAVVDLYDPDAADAAVAAPPEYRRSWAQENIPGVAKELLPDSAKAEKAEAYARSAYAESAFAKRQKSPQSVWAFDVERFFKDWNIKLTKEDKKAVGLRFPNAYYGVKSMLRAWNIFLAAVSLAMLLAMLDALDLPLYSLGSAPLHWSVSLLTKASLWCLWCAYLRAPLDEPTFLWGKKLISCTVWLALALFVAPFYLSIGDDEVTFLPPFIMYIRILWFAVPFLLLVNALSGFKRLSEKLGDWDAVPKWDKQRLFFTPVFFLVCGILLLLLDQASIFLAIPVYGVFVVLWRMLIRSLKAERDTLLQAKLAQSSAEFGAGIDYTKESAPEAEAEA
jgi:hypothetical protein